MPGRFIPMLSDSRGNFDNAQNAKDRRIAAWGDRNGAFRASTAQVTPVPFPDETSAKSVH